MMTVRAGLAFITHHSSFMISHAADQLRRQRIFRPLVVPDDAGDPPAFLLPHKVDAVDAALETRGEVAIGWRDKQDWVEIFVQDEGPGIMNPANLFVPFFTTKPEGSGIGLPLSRQIAEAHGGSLVLMNRENGRGAQALLRLPL